MPDLATEFETHRDHLTAVAYRMLGSRAEAEDAVQEAWLRYNAALGDPAERARIRDLRGWLTTATGRICLDVLRSARVRREAYPGQWLPEPVVTRLPAGSDPAATFAPDPAERASRSDEVGMALLVVLERLSPEQRVAFVLHDVFAVPFDEIAGALGGTPAAARQLASRARRAVADGTPRHTADLAEQRRVLAAFGAATQTGDLTALLAVLAPDVVMIGDGGGLAPAARNPVTGSDKVARFLLGLLRRAARLPGLRTEPVLVNGALGFLVEADRDPGAAPGTEAGGTEAGGTAAGGTAAGGTEPGNAGLRMVVAFSVADGRITGVFDQLNPAKLTGVPKIGPAAGWPPAVGPADGVAADRVAG